MNTSFFKTSGFALIMAASTFTAQTQAADKRLDLKQRNQLFVDGKITNENGELMNVKIVPGIRGTNKIARNSYDEAFDSFAEYIDQDLYRKMGEQVVDGAGTVKDGAVEFVVDDLYEYFLKGLGKDWAENIKDAKEASFLLPLVWTWKVTQAMGENVLRTAGLPFRMAWRVAKVAWGAGYAVVAPGLSFVLPAVYGTGALAWGTAVVPVLYTWSGTAWALSIGSKEPTKDSRWVDIETLAGKKQQVALEAVNDLMELAMVRALPRNQREEMKEIIRENKEVGVFTVELSLLDKPLSQGQTFAMITKAYKDLTGSVEVEEATRAAELATQNILKFAEQ